MSFMLSPNAMQCPASTPSRSSTARSARPRDVGGHHFQAIGQRVGDVQRVAELHAHLLGDHREVGRLADVEHLRDIRAVVRGHVDHVVAETGVLMEFEQVRASRSISQPRSVNRLTITPVRAGHGGLHELADDCRVDVLRVDRRVVRRVHARAVRRDQVWPDPQHVADAGDVRIMPPGRDHELQAVAFEPADGLDRVRIEW
jgi:hypothetical protein